jgi:formate C-acetyltransferase
VRNRIAELKEKLYAMDSRTVFLERLFLMKTGYEKYRNKSPSVRYALILNEILSNISIVIDKDDLVVGRIKESTPTAHEIGVLKDTAQFYEKSCPEDVKPLTPTIEDWALFGRKGNQQHLDGVSFSSIAAPAWFSTTGHVTPSWDTLLNKGMKGVRDTAQQKLLEIDDDPERCQKRLFLEAVTISCDAVINYARRYEKALVVLADGERDEARKKELGKIANVLKRVPAHPAETFHEAVQSVWILDLILHTVCGARDYTLGRMDQYLFPFYKRDIDNGRLSAEDAVELLQNLFIHTVEISGIGDQAHGSERLGYTSTMPEKLSMCRDSVQYLILAGQTYDGNDATNDLSHVILKAVDDLRTKTPNITIRYHRGIDRDFWLEACDVMKRGFNNIGVYNDDVLIGAFIECGVLPEDAINYSHYGCCNPCIPGKDAQIREDQRNLAKILELTLNDGFDPVAKVQRGPHTGKIDEFETFDDLMKAYKIQIRDDVARSVRNKVKFFTDYLAKRPFSFESCLLEGCVEMAMDCNDPRRNPSFGGPGYIHTNFDAGGLATAADSLAAIKNVVYDRREITLHELKAALDNNFADNEALRLKLANKCPKFGNDDDYVDSIAREIGLVFCREVVSYGAKNPVLGQCWPQLYTYHRHRSCGLETGATPNGRRAWEAVSENQSPTSGCDREGLSALIKSLAKMHESFGLTPGGGVTVNVHPSLLKTEDGAKLIADTLETYFEIGGLYLQINVVDRETLADAQIHPEKHRDLVVRVTGYSAYFVTLSPECQDTIISRYSHTS